MIFLSDAFSWTSLAPLVLLILVSVLIPIILSVLKLKIIPVLVIEIACGIILIKIPYVQDFFVTGGQLNSLAEGVYTIGLAMLLFLSGMDIDYSVFGKNRKGGLNAFPIVKISLILIGFVVLASFLCSLFFQGVFVNELPKTKAIGVVSLTIVFSSTFASLVIPLVHDENLAKTTIGQIISTYATIMEFLSIVAISVLMIVLQLSHTAKPWLLGIILVILIVVYLVIRFIPKKLFSKVQDGIVHLDFRLIILSLFMMGILAQISGAEFILGTFLLGAVIKYAGVKKQTKEKIESLGYGFFIPMFFILVGAKVGLMIPKTAVGIEKMIFLTLVTFGIMIIVKLPFLILNKWYKLKTTIPTMLISTSTIIVGIACNHFHVLSNEMSTAIVFASALTCLIPPIIFATDKDFGFSKKEYDDIIVNPNEV